MRMFRVVVNGNEYEVGIEELQASGSPSAARPAPAPQPAASPRPAPQPAAAAPKPQPAKPAATGAAGIISAPMPGTVLRVEVAVGAAVTKGQTLLVLEAMKMENELMAPQDGTVTELNVSPGVSVNAGDTLVVLSS